MQVTNQQALHLWICSEKMDSDSLPAPRLLSNELSCDSRLCSWHLIPYNECTLDAYLGRVSSERSHSKLNDFYISFERLVGWVKNATHLKVNYLLQTFTRRAISPNVSTKFLFGHPVWCFYLYEICFLDFSDIFKSLGF